VNKLQVLGRSGHKELVWDAEKVEEADAETLAVIEEAERIVNEAFARGQAVFRLDAPDQPAVRVDRFDATAPSTVIVPRLAGG
jgi:hypothetical protein